MAVRGGELVCGGEGWVIGGGRVEIGVEKGRSGGVYIYKLGLRG